MENQNRNSLKYSVFFLLFFAFGILLQAKPVQIGDKNTDLKENTSSNSDSVALVALYNSTNGAAWKNKSNWLTGPVKSWYGVVVEDGYVVTVFLSDNNLIGTIPSDLGQITMLRYLDLSDNQLTGSIPSDMGKLYYLQYLKLSGNQLSGSIPTDFGQLGNLSNLDLSSNQLTGSIPTKFQELTSLQGLDLSDNALSGSVPDALGALSSLQSINLSSNQLSGAIPTALAQLSLLTSLILNDNQLSGSISSDLMALTNLSEFNVANNSLSGEIPSLISQLTDLQVLNLSENQLSGNIPTGIGLLTALFELNLANNQLTGSLSSWIGNLTHLVSIDLHGNSLSGSVPTEIGQLKRLVLLNFSDNQFEGTIPVELASLTKLEDIILSDNLFDDFTTFSLSKLSYLDLLSVENNKLTFEDLEDKMSNDLSIFLYYPQSKIGEEKTVTVGYKEDYTLTVSCGGTKNVYQWFFNGEALDSSSSSSSFLVEDFNTDDVGDYYCKITNELVPDLVIISETVHLKLDLPVFIAPANIFVDGCSTSDISKKSAFSYSTTSKQVTVAKFKTEGGTALTDCSAGESSISISYIDVSDGKTLPETVTRTYKISDCQVSTTLTQTITVTDTSPPVAVCKDYEVTLDATGKATVSTAKVDGGSYDYCLQDPYLSLSKSTFTTSDIGENVVTLTATDLAGNTATCEVTITVDKYNDAPVGVILSNYSVDENSSAGTIVGVMHTVDDDGDGVYSYSFDLGVGSTDNTRFYISNDTLYSNDVFDFEEESTLSILVQTKDQGGETTSTQITITVNDVNEAPTGIELSDHFVDESSPVGEEIGVFSTIDVDKTDSYTYSFVSGIGDEDNASFSISGDSLLVDAIFDYETKSSYSVRVQTKDKGGFISVDTFTIWIVDVNETPSDILLSGDTLSEGLAVGSDIGVFSVVDDDTADVYSYALVDGIGSDDNASFKVVGNTLVCAEIFDFETKSSYAIRVKVTDSGGNTYSKSFVITINDVNENPTDILLSNQVINDNMVKGSTLGVLSTVDEDANETFTYSLVAGDGDTDNSSFLISGNELVINHVIDFSKAYTYTIRVQTTDSGGNVYVEVFIITINVPPSDIQLSSYTVDENIEVPGCVAYITAIDSNTNDTFTYYLVNGTGSTDNNCFSVSGDTLFVNCELDYEAKTSYSILVEAVDNGGESVTKAFAITVNNVNEAPYDIALSSQSVDEALPEGTLVGLLSASDEDNGETFTYSLVEDSVNTDYSYFTISGDSLVANESFNYEEKSEYSITIQVEDSAGNTYQETFIISVVNIDEEPIDISLSGQSVDENNKIGTLVGVLSTVDGDANDVFTYTLVSGDGDTDNGSFYISGDSLWANTSFDYETKDSCLIRVQVKDSSGEAYSETFTIYINNVNDAPADIQLSNQTVDESLQAGTEVGIFTTVDQDANETFTYTLVSSSEENDNGSFTISGDTLLTNEEFDYETKNSYTITVQTKDSGDSTLVKTFTILINDIYEPVYEFFVPTVFSPNGDGINDRFKIQAMDLYPNAYIEIYNRWGVMVFKKSNYGNVDVYGDDDAWWDGHYDLNGKRDDNTLPPGTYFVIMKLDESNTYKGTVAILK